MPRRRPVEPRRVIFIGVEGKNDQSFVRFLQFCCNGKGLHFSTCGGQRGTIKGCEDFSTFSVFGHRIIDENRSSNSKSFSSFRL